MRRESFEPVDLFYAHIGGMDAFAKGLKIAAEIIEKGELADMLKSRYSTWDTGIGAEIESGKASFGSLESYILDKGEVAPPNLRPARTVRKRREQVRREVTTLSLYPSELLDRICFTKRTQSAQRMNNGMPAL